VHGALNLKPETLTLVQAGAVASRHPKVNEYMRPTYEPSSPLTLDQTQAVAMCTMPETKTPKPKPRNPKPETRSPKPENRNQAEAVAMCTALRIPGEHFRVGLTKVRVAPMDVI